MEEVPASRPFRYLRDPVFLVAVTLYLLNRFVLRGLTGDSADFFHCYFSDLLCVPFWLPIVLWIQRRSGLRSHDQPPTLLELTAMVVLWSAVFELVVPFTFLHGWFPNAVGDPEDVVMYLFGACLASLLWRSYLAPTVTAEGATSAYLQHAAIALAIVTASQGVAVIEGAGSQPLVLGRMNGMLVGTEMAMAWLLWRAMQRPPMRRLDGVGWLSTLLGVGVILAVAGVLLALQNMPQGVH